MSIRISLELEVEAVPERELGPVNLDALALDVRDYVNDWVCDRTRKEFDEPWRIVNVMLVDD